MAFLEARRRGWVGVVAVAGALLVGSARVGVGQESKDAESPRSKLFDGLDETDPPPRQPSPARRVVDLLKLIEPSKDAVSGTWALNGRRELTCGGEPHARLEIPYKPPAEYDFVIEFTRVKGDADTVQIMSSRHGSNFAYLLGSARGTRALLSRVRAQRNPTVVPTKGLLSNGRRYRSVVSVRDDRVVTALDGRELITYRTDSRDLFPSNAFPLRTRGLLGVGSFRTATVFHRIELVEVSGRGEVAERPAVAAGPPETEPAPATAPAGGPPGPVLAVPPPAAPADGRGVKAELFADTTFRKLVATRYDAEIDFVWGDGVAAEGMPANNFGVRWTGFLRAPAPGQYGIIAHADDDMRVWLDGKPILEAAGAKSDEIILELGKQPHELKVEYVERRGWAAGSLKWRVPGAKWWSVVPAEALFHDKAAAQRVRPNAKATLPKGTGVLCEVYAGHKLEGRPVKRFERQIDWYGRGAAFAPDLPADHFSVRYTSWLRAPKPGSYKLIVNSDDGHRLYLDGKLLAERWGPGAFQSEVLAELTDKPHALKLEYYEDAGLARVTLHWEQLGGFAEQIIPPEAFFTDKAAASAAKKTAP